MIGLKEENEIQYQPSIVGRLARVMLPVLEAVLPRTVYRLTYDFLYLAYKEILKFLYLVKLVAVSILGSREEKSKKKLTWRLLSYSMGGSKALENAFDLTLMVEKQEVPGAIVECGVAQGGTAAMMGLTSDIWGSRTREMWFFDSYEGLPEPTDEDYENGKTGEFIRPLPKGSCLGTIEEVHELLFDQLNLDESRVHLVKGWFQDTVPKFVDEICDVAILRLDGDWYESTKIPLEHFYVKIQEGGYVIVDDYATCFGSRRAVDEFREKNDISVPLNEDGRGGVWFQKRSIEAA